MIELKNELLKITRILDAKGIGYGLCGGLAVAVHGYPRATRDLEFLILPDDKELIRTLIAEIGYTIDGGEFKLREGQGTELNIWRVSRAIEQDLLTLDFVLVNDWLKTFWGKRLKVEVEGGQLMVLDRQSLCTMKNASGRSQDLADIENLKRTDDKKEP